MGQHWVAGVSQISVRPNLNSQSSVQNLIPLILLFSQQHLDPSNVSNKKSQHQPLPLNCLPQYFFARSYFLNVYLTISCSLNHCVQWGLPSSWLFNSAPTSSLALGLRRVSAGMLVKYKWDHVNLPKALSQFFII